MYQYGVHYVVTVVSGTPGNDPMSPNQRHCLRCRARAARAYLVSQKEPRARWEEQHLMVGNFMCQASSESNWVNYG